MNDHELIKRCADASGFRVVEIESNLGLIWRIDRWTVFDPLNDVAQAMALVTRFGLSITEPIKDNRYKWQVFKVFDKEPVFVGKNKCLRRAICEYVANTQKQSKKLRAA